MRSSVVDLDPNPDPYGSETFSRIRIRNRRCTLSKILKNHQNISNLIITTLKNVILTWSLKVCFKMLWKCPFYCLHCEREIIWGRIQNGIQNPDENGIRIWVNSFGSTTLMRSQNQIYEVPAKKQTKIIQTVPVTKQNYSLFCLEINFASWCERLRDNI
jgi:hypothetical protein